MENKKSKNTIIIILIIIIVGLIGFIMYDKVLNNDNKTITENINSNQLEDNKANESDNSNCNYGISDVNNSYELFKDNLIKERTEKYDTSKKYFIVDTNSDETISETKYSLRLYKNGNLEVSYSKNNKTITKIIAENVLLYNVTYAGNDGSKELFFIKEDGTVSSYQIEMLVSGYEGNIEVKNNLGGFKNIVAIISGNVSDSNMIVGFNPSFIDINGNIFVLDNFFS